MLQNVKFLNRMFGVAAVVLIGFAPKPAAAEVLAQTLVDAYNHSGLIEQNRATLRAADEGVAQAIAALRPVLSWSSSISHTFGSRRTFSGGTPSSINGTAATLALTAGLTLYDGGANRLNIDIQKETVLATRAGLLSVEQNVLLRAVQAFMEIQRAQQTVSLRSNNVRVIKQELRAARDRFSVGEVTRTDVSLAEARLAAAQSSLAAAQGSLGASREEFRAAVGRKPGNLKTPAHLPHIPNTVDKAKAHALRSHPELQRLQRVVTVRELGILVAKAALKPSVSLNGSLSAQEGLGNNTFTHSGNIALEAGGAIYQGGRLNSLIRQAMAERDASRAELHSTGHAVTQEVGNAYIQLQVAVASRRASESQVRASQIAFRGVREEATLGQRTTLDVLDAEQELLDARFNLVSAQVDEMVAAYRVLAAIGDLTADKLQLNVPRYDPAAYYNLVKSAPPRAASRQGSQLDRVLKSIGKN